MSTHTVIFIDIYFYKNAKPTPGTFTQIYADVDETIRINYEECENLNRSLYIKRLFKKDFRIPMCPKAYVVLYDEFQNIAFIFNEGNNENPVIFTTDVSCDNSTGKC